MEIVELRNDVVYDPVAVRVRGYQLVLDPQAYTVEMRIRLTPSLLVAREERAMTEARESVEKDATEDVRGEAVLRAQSRFWAEQLDEVLHPPQHRERGRDLNPEWTAERLFTTLDLSDMAEAVFFFRGLGTGERTRSSLNVAPEPQREPPSPASETGPDTSTTSSKPTPPTRRRRS